jgi:hypothetical protein
MTIKFEFEFGKVSYAPGAPKNAPRWVWRCACGKCDGGMKGPFKTLREAKKHAQTIALDIAHSRDSTHH